MILILIKNVKIFYNKRRYTIWENIKETKKGINENNKTEIMNNNIENKKLSKFSSKLIFKVEANLI